MTGALEQRARSQGVFEGLAWGRGVSFWVLKLRMEPQ
jgi:hypothetical protein